MKEKILMDALEALKWMMENMKVVDQRLQSDSFNIPANAIEQIEQYFNNQAS